MIIRLGVALGQVAVSALLVVLSACGGGDHEQAVLLATGESTSSAGNDVQGFALLPAVIVGPTITLPRSGQVRVCIFGAVVQALHFEAAVTVDVALSEPVAGGATLHVAARSAGPVTLRLDHCATIWLPAGPTRLMARGVVRAHDVQGLPVSALARNEAAARWEVWGPE